MKTVIVILALVSTFTLSSSYATTKIETNIRTYNNSGFCTIGRGPCK